MLFVNIIFLKGKFFASFKQCLDEGFRTGELTFLF